MDTQMAIWVSINLLVHMCQGSLAIFVILIFWFAGRQEKIDEEFGFSEKGDD